MVAGCVPKPVSRECVEAVGVYEEENMESWTEV